MFHRSRVVRRLAPALIVAACLPVGLRAQEPPPRVLVVPLEDQLIQPVTERFLIRALRQGAGKDFQCVIVQLDTPGGLIESTRHVVKEILTCNVPVIVYIAPSGGRAASAGVFIALAGHLSAMAPGTNIGPAQMTSVGLGPLPGLNDPDIFGVNRPAPPAPEKNQDDAAAWARALADWRGHNADWAGRAVRDGISATAKEALAEHVVNIVANDLNDLLDQLDRRKIDLIDRSVVVRTKGAAIERLEMTWSERALSLLANPTLAYLLLLLAFTGLSFEMTHPGGWVPGVLGMICLVLAFFAMQLLPINYAGLALIILGFLLVLVELKIHSYGILTGAGIVSLLVGSAMLIEPVGGVERVSWLIVAPVTIALGVIVALLVANVVRSHRAKLQTGIQGMIGTIAHVKGDMNREGFIFVAGELWKARCDQPLQDGEAVRIVNIDGLTVYVKPTH